MPLVTVVIPAYNHEKYVMESVRSVINQTYPNVELIIINDGSKDKTHERILTLIDECKRRFVHFQYINRENAGLSATLNQALSLAKGKYFVPLASDDISFPDKITLLVNALEAAGPKYAAAFGNALFIDDKGCPVHLNRAGYISNGSNDESYKTFLDFYSKSRSFNYMEKEFGTYSTLLAGNYLPAMSSLIRTVAISEVGGWTEGNLIEDWEMWLKLARTFQFLYINEPVAYYRRHDLNTLKTTEKYKVMYSFLQVIDGEKKFSKENGLKLLWSKQHNSHVVGLLRDSHFPFRKKLSIVIHSDKVPLLMYVLKRIATKLGM